MPCYITLQLYKVSKNLAYPWLKYPNNVQLSHDIRIHNIQKLVFVLNRYYIFTAVFADLQLSKNYLKKFYNMEKIILSGFLNEFFVKNEDVIAVRLVVIKIFRKFIPLL